jgi:multicomponent Na+:H+ antiporter subunit D
MGADWAMIGLVIVPLAAALVVFVTGTRSAGAWGAAVAMIQLGLVVWLTRSILESGPVRYLLGGWEPPLGIPLYADGISVLMLIMTTVVGGASTFYAAAYFSSLERDPSNSPNHRMLQTFWPLWLILWSALNALFLSSDIFNLYVTLELITFSAVALIGLAGRARRWSPRSGI